MPRRAPRLCPRCLNTYTGTRCPECEQRREHRQPRNTARKTDYSNPRWIRESKQYLTENPLCACPRCSALPEWERDLAEHVDHIDGQGLRGPRAWDRTNWQGLSARHHSEKTARHDGGFGNRKRPTDDPAPF